MYSTDTNPLLIQLREAVNSLNQAYTQGRGNFFDNIISKKLERFLLNDSSGYRLPLTQQINNLIVFINARRAEAPKKRLKKILSNPQRLAQYNSPMLSELAVKLLPLAVGAAREEFVKPPSFERLFNNVLVMCHLLLEGREYRVIYHAPTMGFRGGVISLTSAPLYPVYKFETEEALIVTEEVNAGGFKVRERFGEVKSEETRVDIKLTSGAVDQLIAYNDKKLSIVDGVITNATFSRIEPNGSIVFSYPGKKEVVLEENEIVSLFIHHDAAMTISQKVDVKQIIERLHRRLESNALYLGGASVAVVLLMKKSRVANVKPDNAIKRVAAILKILSSSMADEILGGACVAVAEFINRGWNQDNAISQVIKILQELVEEPVKKSVKGPGSSKKVLGGALVAVVGLMNQGRTRPAAIEQVKKIINEKLLSFPKEIRGWVAAAVVELVNHRAPEKDERGAEKEAINQLKRIFNDLPFNDEIKGEALVAAALLINKQGGIGAGKVDEHDVIIRQVMEIVIRERFPFIENYNLGGAILAVVSQQDAAMRAVGAIRENQSDLDAQVVILETSGKEILARVDALLRRLFSKDRYNDRIMINNPVLGGAIENYFLRLGPAIWKGLPTFQKIKGEKNGLGGLFYVDKKYGFMEIEGDYNQFLTMFALLAAVDKEKHYLSNLLNATAWSLKDRVVPDQVGHGIGTPTSDAAMTSEEQIKDINDPIVTWDRVEHLVNQVLPGKITRIRLGLYGDFKRYFYGQKIYDLNDNVLEIPKDKIGLSLKTSDDQKEIKEFVIVTKQYFIGVIANLLKERDYQARLVISNLDQKLNDDEIGRVAKGLLDKIDDPLLTPEIKNSILKLGNETHVIKDYNSVPRDYISLYEFSSPMYAGKYEASENRSTERTVIIWPNIDGTPGREKGVMFKPGYLKLMIADLFKADPPKARRFIAALFDISPQEQAKAARIRISMIFNKEQEMVTLLDALSGHLAEKETGIRISSGLGVKIEKCLGIFHFNQLSAEGVLSYDKKGPWGFKGDKNEYFIWLADLAGNYRETFDELIKELNNPAMKTTEDKAVLANGIENPGGIDLNTSNGMQWKINKDGNGVEMNIDPAMIERVRREGIDSLSPMILRMTPVASIWSLVGLPKK